MKLQDILKEIQSTKFGKYVYATCDEEGQFEWLLVLNTSQILRDNDSETEDEKEIWELDYIDNNGDKRETWYIERIKI